MDLPHDQNSNATRPSSNHLSENPFEPQTNTSEHNPILSQDLNEHQNLEIRENQQSHAPEFQSQRIPNSTTHYQDQELSQNRQRVVRAHSITNNMLENEQNQQLNPHLPIQPYQQPSDENQDQFLLGTTQEAIAGAYTLPNSNQPLQKMEGTHPNQHQVAYKFHSQAETDLLHFGATLQEQMQKENRQILQQAQQRIHYQQVQQIAPKHQPMDIQVDSKGSLNQNYPQRHTAYQYLQNEQLFQKKWPQQNLASHQNMCEQNQAFKQPQQELIAIGHQPRQVLATGSMENVLLKREQNQVAHEQIRYNIEGGYCQEDVKVKSPSQKEPGQQLDELPNHAQNYIASRQPQNIQIQQKALAQDVFDSHQQINPIAHHAQCQIDAEAANHENQPPFQTNLSEIQPPSQYDHQQSQNQQHLDNKAPTQNHQITQNPPQMVGPEQKKDELPSQIPSDEWQIIDDSHSKKPPIPMQIESISGIKQDNLVSFDQFQSVHGQSHPLQKQSMPANSILDKSFIISSREAFPDSHMHSETKLVSQQPFLTGSQEAQAPAKQNEWYEIKQESKEWKIQKDNQIANQIITIYERTDIYQSQPTPPNHLRETHTRDSELSTMQKHYVVQVIQCGEQDQKLQLSVVKNNNIYGCEETPISPSKSARENQEHDHITSANKPQHYPEQRQDEAVRPVQYRDEGVQWQPQSQQKQPQIFETSNQSQRSQALNEHRNQPQFHQPQQQQEQTVSNKKPQQLTQKKEWHFEEDQPGRQMPQHHEQQITVESVVKQLQMILQNATHEADQYRFEMFECVIQRHINLLFLKPNDSIGQTILQNGEYAILFAELMVLNSPVAQERNLLQKYLTSTLSHNIKTNQQIYQRYKSKFWPRKSDIFTQTKEASFGTSPQKGSKKDQEDSSATLSNYSIQVHDPSVHQGPRSIMKSHRKQAIKQPRTQMPLKRGAIQGANKARSRSRPKETNHLSNQLDKSKKIGVTKKRVTLNQKNLGVPDQKLGMAQTFVTVVDSKGKQVLQSVKVSRRLLQKSQKKDQKPQSKRKRSVRRNPRIEHNQSVTIVQTQKQSPKRSRSRRKTINRSARKTDNQNKALNADYIKSHFQELKIAPQQLNQLNGNFLTQADQQIAKILSEYQKAVEQEKRLVMDLEISQSQPIEAADHYQNEDYQSNSISMRTKQQILRELQKNKEKKHKMMQELTQNHIVVEQVIDPDINGHGIYALVKVSKLTAVLCGARYFLVPMSKLELCSRKTIDEDISAIKMLVEESERDNIGVLRPSVRLQAAIEAQIKKRDKKQGKKARP